jgi:dsRNA-specific ribonuclease
MIGKGDTTDALKSHASNDVLAGKCDENGLTPCVLPAPGVRALANNTKATAVEAVIGAVFLDGGYEASSRVMRALGLIFEGQVTF